MDAREVCNEYCTGDDVKERLLEYRSNWLDVERQLERLERLHVKMIGVGAQNITDMPKNPSPSHDKWSDLVSQEEELEEEIRETIKALKEERRRIERIIKRLRNPDERAVIRIRYIDREEWDSVTFMLFGEKDDFGEREETYTRRTYRHHNDALENMAAYIASHGDPFLSIPMIP